MDLPKDYLEIKCEVFRVIRANSDKRSAKQVMKAIKDHLPDVPPEVIRHALGELYT
jgi:hypothetical protein